VIAGEGYLRPFPSPNRQRQSAEGVTGKTAGPGRNPDGFSVDPGSLFSSTGLCVIPKQYGWAYCFRTGYRGSVALHLKSMGKLPATSVKTGSSIVTDYGSGKIDKTARSHQRQVSQPTIPSCPRAQLKVGYQNLPTRLRKQQLSPDVLHALHPAVCLPARVREAAQ